MLVMGDTRSNHEDFALTPYLGWVYEGNLDYKAYGLSLTWGYWSVILAIGTGIVNDLPHVLAIDRKDIQYRYSFENWKLKRDK